MKVGVLDQLVAAEADRQPAATITRLSDGRQALWLDGRFSGELELPDAVRTEVSSRIVAAHSGPLAADEGLFLRVYSPAPRLLVVGAVHIAQALAPMAALAGFDVTIIDPRRAFANADRFPGITLVSAWPDAAMAELAPDAMTGVVTLAHDPKIDDPALLAALDSEAFYIGALGSRRTHERRCERLRAEGCTEASLARIHAPVGLSLGGRMPGEIAVAIVAQAMQARYGTES